jgi:hypothetical protein
LPPLTPIPRKASKGSDLNSTPNCGKREGAPAATRDVPLLLIPLPVEVEIATQLVHIHAKLNESTEDKLELRTEAT